MGGRGERGNVREMRVMSEEGEELVGEGRGRESYLGEVFGDYVRGRGKGRVGKEGGNGRGREGRDRRRTGERTGGLIERLGRTKNRGERR